MALVGPLSSMISGYYPCLIYTASVDPHPRWPTFTFISPINHLAVQSPGLSVEERRGLDHNGINSPKAPQKGAPYYACKRAVIVSLRIKRNTNFSTSRDDKREADCFDNRHQWVELSRCYWGLLQYLQILWFFKVIVQFKQILLPPVIWTSHPFTPKQPQTTTVQR